MRRLVKIFKFINDHGSMLILILAVLAVILWFLIKYLNKQNLTDSKKSLIITFYSFTSILLLLFFLRFWPPYGKAELLIAQGGEGAVMVNFGDTDFGKGDDYLNETLEVNMKEVASEPVESTPDEILTQDNVGAEVPTPSKTNVKPNDKKPTEKLVKTPKTPVRKTNSTLANMIKGKNKGGDGDSEIDGNQGKLNGDPYSKNYKDGDGKPGKNPGTNSGFKKDGYTLTGRKLAYIPPIDNNCNQAGLVTIEVTVDKNGKTISAVNAKGSTADACLIALAKRYALQTKWQPSSNGAEKQVGNIIYNFSF